MPSEPPKISSVIYAPSRFEVIRKVVLHLHAQSIRHWIELVIACPRADALEADLALLKDFASCKIVEAGAGLQFAARAEAIRQATAPIVALHEDHAYPDTGWGEAMLEGFADGHDAVGPTMYNANPRTALSETMFVLYHNYAMPKERGERATMLSDNNAAYKREILIGQYGDKLEWWLTHVYELQADMLRRGCRLFQCPQARVYHINISHPWHAAVMRFNGGRLYGARRSAKWPAFRRVLYFLGGPLIPLPRSVREFPVVRRLRHPDCAMSRLLPAFLAIEIAAGFGEMAGYVLGEGKALELRHKYEVNRGIYLSATDRRALGRAGLSLPIGTERA